MSDEKAMLYKKMAAVMNDLNRIPKNGRNKEQNYDYATSEDIKQAIRAAMAKNNLALLFELAEFTIEEVVSRSGTKGKKIVGKLDFTLACGDTGETVNRSIWAEAIDWQDKAFNKLYTTGEKYFLITTFLVSTGDEDDADSGPVVHETGNQQTIKPAKQDKKPEAQQAQPATKQPEATTNGNGSQSPNTPSALLQVLKNKGFTYNAVDHLLNAIKQEQADFVWPKPNDTDGWRNAYKLAKQHKTAPAVDTAVKYAAKLSPVEVTPEAPADEFGSLFGDVPTPGAAAYSN